MINNLELISATISAKRQRGLCVTPYCRNKARHGRTKCQTCRSRAYDSAHPLNRKWRDLKSHAKRRHKVFAIPLQCFELWAAINGYNRETTGRAVNSITIDRKYPFCGYYFANMQPLELVENIRKHYVDEKIYGSTRVMKNDKTPIEVDEPF